MVQQEEPGSEVALIFINDSSAMWENWASSGWLKTPVAGAGVARPWSSRYWLISVTNLSATGCTRLGCVEVHPYKSALSSHKALYFHMALSICSASLSLGCSERKMFAGVLTEWRCKCTDRKTKVKRQWNSERFLSLFACFRNSARAMGLCSA